MTTKLTLSLDQEVIKRAKKFAKNNRISLSVLVENYFRFLTEKKYPKDEKISPMVRELSGIVKIPDRIDTKEEYVKYLTEKYK